MWDSDLRNISIYRPGGGGQLGKGDGEGYIQKG